MYPKWFGYWDAAFIADIPWPYVNQPLNAQGGRQLTYTAPTLELRLGQLSDGECVEPAGLLAFNGNFLYSFRKGIEHIL